MVTAFGLSEAKLTWDLALDTLLAAMARGDDFLREAATSVLMSGLSSPDDIRYRQDVLRDCISRPQAVTALYELAAGAITAEKQVYRGMFSSPGYTLHRAVEVLRPYMSALRKLRERGSRRERPPDPDQPEGPRHRTTSPAPRPSPAGEPALTAHGLYDSCLSLSTGRAAVGNDISADGKNLIVITGAKQGGKRI